jgi:uncharacterized membrane protein
MAVELSPEEKRRVYEEEKARLETEEKLAREKGRAADETSTGLNPDVEALLCYLGWWVTGLIFFILEQKNPRSRFHAAQSLVFFGAVTVVAILIGWIPVVGGIFAAIVVIIGFIFWIVLMVKAYQGEHYTLPVAGEIAERMAAPAGRSHDYYYHPPSKPPSPAAASSPAEAESAKATAAPAIAGTPPSIMEELDRQEVRRAAREARRHRRERREARIAGGAFAIAWFIVLFFVLNFLYQYIGYWNAQTANGVVTWTHHSIFTGDVTGWLPLLNVTLAVAIAGHFFLMFLENGLVRRSIRIVMQALGLAAGVSLLFIYPFNFSVIPDSTAAAVTQLVVTVVLVLIAIGLGISLIARVIGLLVRAARSLSRDREAD